MSALATKALRIGEVAELTGTTPRTIRYYEEIGLLPGAADRTQGRHRSYTEADVESGLPKAAAAARHVSEINSEVRVEPRVADITPENVLDLLEGAR